LNFGYTGESAIANLTNRWIGRHGTSLSSSWYAGQRVSRLV